MHIQHANTQHTLARPLSIQSAVLTITWGGYWFFADT